MQQYSLGCFPLDCLSHLLLESQRRVDILCWRYQCLGSWAALQSQTKHFLIRQYQVCRNLFLLLVTRWCSSAGQVLPQSGTEASRCPEVLGCLFSYQVNFINLIFTSDCRWFRPFFGKGDWTLSLLLRSSFLIELVPWKAVMTGGIQSHGLKEFNEHFRRMAHRLRELYLCVYQNTRKMVVIYWKVWDVSMT